MNYREPKEIRIRCRVCTEVIERARDINQSLSSAGSKICVRCAPIKEAKAW